MILYSLPISNYCGKVLHALRFKDLECEILPPPGGYGSEEYKKRVPSGTIPALDHDGVILSESEVINEYLNEVFPEPNLLPGSAEQRAKIRMLCRLHDLKLEPIVRSLFPAMSPEKRDAEMVEKRLEEMEQSLERLRGLIQPGPFLVGHAFWILPGKRRSPGSKGKGVQSRIMTPSGVSSPVAGPGRKRQ